MAAVITMEHHGVAFARVIHQLGAWFAYKRIARAAIVDSAYFRAHVGEMDALRDVVFKDYNYIAPGPVFLLFDGTGCECLSERRDRNIS